jgi:sulfoacetaldehyde acetyltransferase
MTNSEAFVETLRSREVDVCFGIVGSAFMDALDLFPTAGIRFLSVQHEQNAAHMADGYYRASGKTGVCIAQNGPGISNFVTGVAAAYSNHSPIVCITPEAGSATKGWGGFQEVHQLPMFEDITKYQGHVHHPSRMAEITGRCFDEAQIQRGPTQLNIPRDYYYGENTITVPKVHEVELTAGGVKSLAAAAAAIATAKNPVILAGAGVVMGDSQKEVQALAEYLQAPVATTYLHNDAFPADHPLWCGPLGYLGHKTAMHSMRDADVVIALGTRLGPFGSLGQYGEEYWPKDATLIQVDANPAALTGAKQPDVTVCGDAGLAATAMLSQLQAANVDIGNADDRMAQLEARRSAWETELDEMTYGGYRPVDGEIKQREALRVMEELMPSNAMVSTDIGNTCSISNGYLRFTEPRSFFAAGSYGNCGYAFPTAMGAKVARPDRPSIAYAGEGAWGMSLNETMTCVRENIPVTAVVFNNKQWGAEKKNQVLWFGDRYVGTQLENPSFAEVARAMGAEGITCNDNSQVGDAFEQSLRNQEEGKTTILELMTSRELGDPFIRDAMHLPVRRLAHYKHTDRDHESPTEQPVDLKTA